MASLFNNHKIWQEPGIYRIVHYPTQKVYIGSSKNMGDRKIRHFVSLKKGCHENPHFQNVYNKYGIEGFVFEPLVWCQESELAEREQWWIDYYKDHYGWKNMMNCEDKAYSRSGRTVTAETRERMAAAKRGNKYRLGKPTSEYTKSRVADASSKRWIVSDPRGNGTAISNLRAFCRDNSLDYSGMIKTASGKHKAFKGWMAHVVDF